MAGFFVAGLTLAAILMLIRLVIVVKSSNKYSYSAS